MEQVAVPGRRKLADALTAVASSRAFLIAALLIAVALRTWHVSAIRGLPLFDRLIIDSEVYDAWARLIASGDWLSEVLGGPFYMDPLYSYFLAVVYRLAGRDLLVVRVIQIGFAVATCGLIALLGRRISGPAAGNIGAMLYAVYLPAVFQDGEFEKTSLAVFLATASLVLFLQRSATARLGSGVMLGLAALTRGNVLLFLPAGLAVLATQRAWRSAAFFAVGASLAITPSLMRNHHVSGQWIPTTSSLGQVLYTGNNPWNTVGAYPILPFLRGQAAHEEGDFLNEAQRRTGRQLNESEASRFWLGETLEHFATSPRFAASMMARKVALFWSNVEVPDGWDMTFVARYSVPLRLPLATFALVSALALVGCFAVARSPDGRIVIGYVVVYSAAVAAFFIFSRYRLPAVPPLAALAGAGIVWAVESASAHDYRRLVIPGLLGAALFAFSAISFDSMRVGAVQNFGTLAELYEERGDFSAARRVLSEAPAGHPRVLCALGRLSVRTGDGAAGVDYMSRCLRADSLAPDGWYWFGLALETAGNHQDAQRAFRQQLSLIPGHQGALAKLQGRP